jgi:hypothetical protein
VNAARPGLALVPELHGPAADNERREQACRGPGEPGSELDRDREAQVYRAGLRDARAALRQGAARHRARELDRSR